MKKTKNKKANKGKFKLTLREKAKLTLREKEKVAQEWAKKNGGASFDLKERQIILHDGGGFSIEKEIKYLPRRRLKPIVEGPLRGMIELVPIKGPKVRHEFYNCYYSFIDLDETINRLRRMKKMLNGLGYRTDYQLQNKKGGKK